MVKAFCFASVLLDTHQGSKIIFGNIDALCLFLNKNLRPKKMKTLWILPFVLLITYGAHAQKKGKKSDTATTTNTPTTLRRPQADKPAVNINYLPLYGQQTKTAAQEQEDQAFLADCDRNFSNREEASKFFESRAWEYLREGRLDTATHRFNLAWLLNNKNVNTYWGLGAISAGRGQDDQAINLLEKALALDPNNSPLLTDIASVHLNKFKDQKDKKELKTSVELLQKAIGIDTTNSTAYTKMSVAYYYQEDYDKAWEYLHKGRALALDAIDFTYLTELIAKKEDPQGIFK